MNRYLFRPLIAALTLALVTSSSIISAEHSPVEFELRYRYEFSCRDPSDINEHLPVLRALASECSTVVEIGLNAMVSTWGIMQGLSENPSSNRYYLGIDPVSPAERTINLFGRLAEAHGITFTYWQANDMDIDFWPTELLFIDSLHTYCHLTSELEKFSPKVSKYIAMHDTSAPWGNKDDDAYHGNYTEYPAHIDRNKRGLWIAVVDFLKRHPEWVLHERRLNNHGFTILKRVAPEPKKDNSKTIE